MASITEKLGSGVSGLLRVLARKVPPLLVTKRNRATAVAVDRLKETAGLGQDWAKTSYGDYYATSVSIYSAIKIRSEALARPPLVVLRDTEPVGEAHPVQQLFDRVNRWYTKGELWRATEIYLNLWGSVYWALERDERGQWEIWPLRPDRVRILPDRENYVKGYVYLGLTGPVAYTSEELIWIRYFNPLEEYAGLSPVAPVRLSVDMGLDALKFNRNFFRNSAQPDMIFTTEESMTDEEVENFYQRWDKRFRGPGNAHRPAIASFIKDIKTVSPAGISQREMDFVQSLRWSLEDVSRAFGVPKPLLSDLERATFANINTAERLFWRNTMIPEMAFLEEQLNEKLLPRLGYPELKAKFDLTAIEALGEEESNRVAREVQLLDRGVLTINELRRQRNLPNVPWGDVPFSRSKGAQSNAKAGQTGPNNGQRLASESWEGPTWVRNAEDNGREPDRISVAKG